MADSKKAPQKKKVDENAQVKKQVKKVAKKATKKALKNRNVQIAIAVIVVLLVIALVVVYFVKPEIFDSSRALLTKVKASFAVPSRQATPAVIGVMANISPVSGDLIGFKADVNLHLKLLILIHVIAQIIDF